jgi:hypothetical protein
MEKAGPDMVLGLALLLISDESNPCLPVYVPFCFHKTDCLGDLGNMSPFPTSWVGNWRCPSYTRLVLSARGSVANSQWNSWIEVGELPLVTLLGVL